MPEAKDFFVNQALLTGEPYPVEKVDDDYLNHPRHWDMKFIRNFMLIIGPVSSVFDFLTFYILHYADGLPCRRGALSYKLVY